MANQLSYNPHDTEQWLNKDARNKDVIPMLSQFIKGGWMISDINEIVIGLKLESLVKLPPKFMLEQVQARIIAFQERYVAAIFSPVFIKIKQRFKSLLSSKFVYTDGLTPHDINLLVEQCTNVEWMLENDLSKQDRQTDDLDIQCEMMMYHILGLDPKLLKLWRTVHEEWRLQGRLTSGFRQHMRTTGQSTTAYGNAFVNLLVHCDLVEKNYNNIVRMFFLGDDMIVLSRRPINQEKLRKNIADKYNMLSKTYVTQNGGQFCGMLFVQTMHGLQFVPDVVRMVEKFEVPNKFSGGTLEVQILKRRSYMHTLCYQPEFENIRGCDTSDIPMPYYDFNAMINGACERYEINYEECVNLYKHLIYMFNELNVEKVEYTIWRS
jgi:hypothetical protein